MRRPDPSQFFAPAVPVTGAVAVEFRRAIFSENADVRALRPGMTIAEIVAAFDTPDEFASYGAVFIRSAEIGRDHEVDRGLWHHVRPKAGTAIFISCVPQGGEGRSIFALVAAIALVALTAWVGAGGIGFLAPTLLGPGTTGAQVAGAAIGIQGEIGLAVFEPSPPRNASL